MAPQRRTPRLLSKEDAAAAKRLHSIWIARKRDLGLTQERAAQLLGWSSQGTVYQYLRGRIPLGLEATLRFADLLGVDPLDIRPDYADLIRTAKSSGMAPGPSRIGQRPLIAWEDVVSWIETTNPESIVPLAYYPCSVQCSRDTYVLEMRGDSMAPEIRDGELVFVDPQVTPKHGSLVVCYRKDEDETLLRKLVIEGKRKMLETINPQWPDSRVQILDEAVIWCGVVIFLGRVP